MDAALSCRHFGSCGGCSALTTPFAEQVAAKHARVQAALAPFAADVELVSSPPPPLAPRHFRTKLLYPTAPDRSGRLCLGLYRRGSHELVRIAECQVQHPALTELGTRAERILRELGLTPWDERAGTGFVRALHARLAAGTGELLVGIVTRPGAFPQASALAERLHEAARDLPGVGSQVPRSIGVVRSIGTRAGNFLLGETHAPLRGRDYLEDRQDGLVFRIGFASFYQVHAAASALFYGPALQMLGAVRGSRVIDGYGGVGTLGLRVAAAGAADVLVVEASAAACADAAISAARNGLSNLRVQVGAFAEAAFAASPDALLVDPPRVGLGPAGVARVLAARPARVLLASCGLAALVRDVGGLVAGGYRVGAARLCDLFPHTEHAEVLTLLTPA